VLDQQRDTFNPDDLLGKSSEDSVNNLEKSVGYQELNLLSKLLLTNEKRDSIESTNMVLLDLFQNEESEYNSQYGIFYCQFFHKNNILNTQHIYLNKSRMR
jgi:hypothetical protein